jgi:tetratricopeptide (TPR) repeat protein
LLSSITNRFPDDAEVWAALGNLHLLQNRPAEAERCWQHALRFYPLDERVLKSLAVLQGRQKNLARAIATTRQLLRADPWQAAYHLQLAEYLDDSGDLQQAMTEVEEALEINPTVLSVREWLAAAYRKSGRTDDALREERLVERMRNR